MGSTLKRLFLVLLPVAVIGVTARPVAAAGPIQRFLLVVGANAGGGDRVKLQYAISDAERFARVMVELGGVLPANEVVLKQPRLKELVDALDALAVRVTDARRVKDAGRIEIILYYSGHADEQGLLLGGDRYTYRSLRDRLDAIAADVRIAVLDACASGAFTRLKGGRARPPFLVDGSAAMRGHAFLTSSAETESAQESDRIRSSYFTHYLISGFRGAADSSGDGKVTLNEAYQFAFNETLGRTVDTRGGAQHPSYDINLTGSGDVVMTDMRQTTSTLALTEDLDGRVFVRNSARELVAEVYKPAGRRVELGVEPGEYEIRIERQNVSAVATIRVADGKTASVEPKQFGPVVLEATRNRGDTESRFAVSDRNRMAVRFGRVGLPTKSIVSGNSITFVGFEYTYFLNEALAVTAELNTRGEHGAGPPSNGSTFAGTANLLSLPVGVQWNPWTASSAVKPFLAIKAGPVHGSSDGSVLSGGRLVPSNDEAVTIGGFVGGGLDVQITRAFTAGINCGYNWMADFSRPIGPRKSYNRVEVGVRLGFLYGKGR